MKFLKNRPTLSWCLYDWANSVLATIIFTFVFAVYFSRGIVGDEILGSAYWGYAVGVAGIVVAIASPILGAISDAFGPRKHLLGILTLVTIGATASLFWMEPDPSYTFYALGIVVVTIVGFELAQAQYNAMLSDVAPPDKIGRVSGWAWGMGYFGGLCCLVVALLGFIGLGDYAGFLNLPREGSIHVRATCILAALWYGVFALPLFLYVPDRPKKQGRKNLVRKGIKSLISTLKSLASTSKNTLRFLIASAIYRDGLNTLFTVGGLYAAGTFGMNFEEILIFAIGLNVTSGIGAVGFAYMDDRRGAKPTIVVSLIALIILGVGLILVDDKTHFMILALCLGFFIGPVQSSSRSMMARLAPKNAGAEFFGLYAMTGKSVAFTGPIAFALITQMMDSQRWGISAIIVLWVVGLIILLKVKETGADA
ncbi:MAG: MFS transporter [Alphaproteobacteria bacterium]|nr:MAG: MFS transporter [Alphaproteobacteria bacterium]